MDIIDAAPAMRVVPDVRWAWWTALLLLCAVLVAPLLLVVVPPLLDYPNHLARMVVLAWPHDPTLSRFATTHWAIIPDLAIDSILPPLIHVLPVYLAGRIVVACVMLLPVVGTVAYNRAIFGQRSWWALGIGLIAYNEAVLLGFLNFVASTGIALLIAAAWIRWRNTYPRQTALLGAVGALLVFFCHIMGVVILFVLLLASEIAQLRSKSSPVIWHGVRRITLLAAIFLPVAGLYAVSPLSDVSGTIEFSSLHDKARLLLMAFVNYDLRLDAVTAGAVVLFVATMLVTRRCHVAAGSGIAIAAFLLLFAAAPAAAKAGENIDMRFAILVALMLFAGIQPQRLPRPAAIAAAALFIGLFATRMAVLAMAWHGSTTDIASLRAVIAPVRPGSAVFIASVTPNEAPQYWQDAPRWRRLSNGQREDIHMPGLVMVDRHAFWPFLFANPSQQPIEETPKYRALAGAANPLPEHLAFAAWDPAILCGFDYVLLLDAGGEPDVAHFAVDRLELIADSDFVALYRVRPQPHGCGGN